MNNTSKILHELDKMCSDMNFDKSKANELLSMVDVNQEFVPCDSWFNTTLLDKASECANVDMIELILQHGADTNLIFDGEACALWNLQYPDFDEKHLSEKRLKIAQMLLEHGANPNIRPVNTAEDLFEYVSFSLFEDEYDDLWEYRSKFFILLVAYGGKTVNCAPKIIQNFDKNDMSKYRFLIKQNGDGSCCGGVIQDEKGSVVAYI